MFLSPQEPSSEDHPQYSRSQNHQQRNLSLHNNRIAMNYKHNDHHDNMYQQRYNETNNFYPPPPKLTTFATEDMSGVEAEQQQSYHYMVGLSKCDDIHHHRFDKIFILLLSVILLHTFD